MVTCRGFKPLNIFTRIVWNKDQLSIWSPQKWSQQGTEKSRPSGSQRSTLKMRKRCIRCRRKPVCQAQRRRLPRVRRWCILGMSRMSFWSVRITLFRTASSSTLLRWRRLRKKEGIKTMMSAINIRALSSKRSSDLTIWIGSPKILKLRLTTVWWRDLELRIWICRRWWTLKLS